MTKDSKVIEIIAVGDLCFSDHPLCPRTGVQSQIEQFGSDYPFAKVKKLLSSGNILFGNLETVVADEELQTDRQSGFISDPQICNSLSDIGFDILNVANNHSLQHGVEGFWATVDNIHNVGIHALGLYGDDGFSSVPVIKDIQGQKIAFIGYGFTPENFHPNEACYAQSTLDCVVRDIEKLSKIVDHVVVSCHWGVELAEGPSAGLVGFAHSIIDAGARLILGHHPHVWQGAESYKNGLILYSLGDFVFDLAWCKQCRNTGIAVIKIDGKQAPKWSCVPIEINKKHQPQLMPTAKTKKFLRQLEKLSDLILELPVEEAGTPPDKLYMAKVNRQVQKNQIAKVGHVLRNAHRFSIQKLLQIAIKRLKFHS